MRDTGGALSYVSSSSKHTIDVLPCHNIHSFLSTHTSTLNMLNSIYAQKHTHHSFYLQTHPSTLYAKQHFLC